MEGPGTLVHTVPGPLTDPISCDAAPAFGDGSATTP